MFYHRCPIYILNSWPIVGVLDALAKHVRQIVIAAPALKCLIGNPKAVLVDNKNKPESHTECVLYKEKYIFIFIFIF